MCARQASLPAGGHPPGTGTTALGGLPSEAGASGPSIGSAGKHEASWAGARPAPQTGAAGRGGHRRAIADCLWRHPSGQALSGSVRSAKRGLGATQVGRCLSACRRDPSGTRTALQALGVRRRHGLRILAGADGRVACGRKGEAPPAVRSVRCHRADASPTTSSAPTRRFRRGQQPRR